jgi:hypothetical protein
LSLLAAVKAVKMCKSVFMSCSLNPRLTCWPRETPAHVKPVYPPTH